MNKKILVSIFGLAVISIVVFGYDSFDTNTNEKSVRQQLLENDEFHLLLHSPFGVTEYHVAGIYRGTVSVHPTYFSFSQTVNGTTQEITNIYETSPELIFHKHEFKPEIRYTVYFEFDRFGYIKLEKPIQFYHTFFGDEYADLIPIEEDPY